jgi:hypothetical protein
MEKRYCLQVNISVKCSKNQLQSRIYGQKISYFPQKPRAHLLGCDKYCAATDLQCGNGSERIQHPFELDGPDWYRQGDWRNLLSQAQQIELGILPAPQAAAKPAKPHIRLPVRKRTSYRFVDSSDTN